MWRTTCSCFGIHHPIQYNVKVKDIGQVVAGYMLRLSVVRVWCILARLDSIEKFALQEGIDSMGLSCLGQFVDVASLSQALGYRISRMSGSTQFNEHKLQRRDTAITPIAANSFCAFKTD